MMTGTELLKEISKFVRDCRRKEHDNHDYEAELYLERCVDKENLWRLTT